MRSSTLTLNEAELDCAIAAILYHLVSCKKAPAGTWTEKELAEKQALYEKFNDAELQ